MRARAGRALRIAPRDDALHVEMRGGSAMQAVTHRVERRNDDARRLRASGVSKWG